jgi:malonyl-CoA decarboxylase
MSMFAQLLASAFERRPQPADPCPDNRPVAEVIADLVGTRGEASGRVLAQEILNRYKREDDVGKRAFFRYLADEMDVDAERVLETLTRYDREKSKAAYHAFQAASEPPRQELIRRLNQVPGATTDLVRMRADLLRFGRQDDRLMALDLDFRHLFVSWFNRGFLVMRPINWESPAHILEKIIAYEAVHAIDSWSDLRRRLLPGDRRCYAFFHPAMADEPLIFVEIALTSGIPRSVQFLLDDGMKALAASEADTAVFYSISNCQPGLAGISFGQSLIKQVAADLGTELPGLKTFVTLSPVPGLARWLDETGLADLPQPDLGQLAARYLLTARRKDGLPVDPVARFHLGNGAELHALHENADTSAKGQQQSRGVMVNYLYDLARVSENHEAYAASGTLAASGAVRELSEAAEAILKKEPAQ